MGGGALYRLSHRKYTGHKNFPLALRAEGSYMGGGAYEGGVASTGVHSFFGLFWQADAYLAVILNWFFFRGKTDLIE